MRDWAYHFSDCEADGLVMCCDCVCSAGTGAVCAWNWHDVLSKVICTVFSLR